MVYFSFLCIQEIAFKKFLKSHSFYFSSRKSTMYTYYLALPSRQHALTTLLPSNTFPMSDSATYTIWAFTNRSTTKQRALATPFPHLQFVLRTTGGATGIRLKLSEPNNYRKIAIRATLFLRVRFDNNALEMKSDQLTWFFPIESRVISWQ